MECPERRVTHGYTQRTRPGGEISIVCDTGYYPNGPNSICIAGTEIKGDTPECLRKFWFSYVSLIICFFSFHQTSIMLSNQSFKKSSLTKSNFSPPTARACRTPSISHGRASTSPSISPGAPVTVRCDNTNYLLSHSRRVTCVTEGRFSEELPTCDGERKG